MVLLIREWRIQPCSITSELMEINFSATAVNIDAMD